MTGVQTCALPIFNFREQWTLIPLIFVCFWIGLYPKPFFDRMAPTVDRVMERVSVALPEADLGFVHGGEGTTDHPEESESKHGE